MTTKWNEDQHIGYIRIVYLLEKPQSKFSNGFEPWHWDVFVDDTQERAEALTQDIDEYIGSLNYMDLYSFTPDNQEYGCWEVRGSLWARWERSTGDWIGYEYDVSYWIEEPQWDKVSSWQAFWLDPEIEAEDFNAVRKFKFN